MNVQKLEPLDVQEDGDREEMEVIVIYGRPPPNWHSWWGGTGQPDADSSSGGFFPQGAEDTGQPSEYGGSPPRPVVKVGLEGSGADLEKKREADLKGMKQEIKEALDDVVDVWQRRGAPTPVITSGCEASSDHGGGSFHYSGLAFDIRGKNVSDAEMRALANDLQEQLGDDYDVVAEFPSDPNRHHVHVEYDPDDLWGGVCDGPVDDAHSTATTGGAHGTGSHGTTHGTGGHGSTHGTAGSHDPPTPNGGDPP